MLPFANLGGDPSQDYFADGITEDLITDLTKLSGLDVIARNSVFAYKDKPAALTDVARDLGVRFVVEGSVRRTGEQIRVNAQLIDTATGDNLWAEPVRSRHGRRVCRPGRDEPARSPKRLACSLRRWKASGWRARRPTISRPTTTICAPSRRRAPAGAPGCGRRWRSTTRRRRSTPLSPKPSRPTQRTTVYVWRASFDDILQSAPARKRAYEKASRALQLDPDLSSPYAILGIMQVVDRRYEEAIASAERAVALGPGDAEAQIALGYVQLFAGNHAEAAAAVETALRLDPNLSAIDRQVAGLVFLLQGDNDKAIETLERARDDAPGGRRFHDHARRGLCARRPLDGARAAVAEGLRLLERPRFNCIGCCAAQLGPHFRNAQDLAVYHRRSAARPACPNGRSASPADERDR